MCCSKLNSAELNLLFSLKISCYSCKKKKKKSHVEQDISITPENLVPVFISDHVVLLHHFSMLEVGFSCEHLIWAKYTEGGVLCIHLDALVSVYRGFRLCSHGNREVSYSVPWLRRCVSLCLSVCLTNYPSKRE